MASYLFFLNLFFLNIISLVGSDLTNPLKQSIIKQTKNIIDAIQSSNKQPLYLEAQFQLMRTISVNNYLIIVDFKKASIKNTS